MTRASLNSTLRFAYVVLLLVLALALAARLSGHIPGIAGSYVEALARDVYEIGRAHV